jgi:hypothetical protein
MQPLLDRLQRDFARKTLGELIQEREAAAFEIECLTRELTRCRAQVLASHEPPPPPTSSNVATRLAAEGPLQAPSIARGLRDGGVITFIHLSRDGAREVSANHSNWRKGGSVEGAGYRELAEREGHASTVILRLRAPRFCARLDVPPDGCCAKMRACGGMDERFKSHAWKACLG